MSKYAILDAGHCHATAGKRSPGGALMEWEFNNSMQYRVKKRLEELGVTVYLVNPDPQKGSEVSLKARCDRANSYYKSKGKPADTIFVSLHANASGNTWSNARGVETFTTSGCSSKSDRAAKFVNDQIYADVKAVDSGFKNRGCKKASYYVIKNTNCPAILVEYEFYSNKDGVNLLKNRRDLLCEATVKGLCKHFNITYKPPGNVTQPPKPEEPSKPSNNKYPNGTYNKSFKVVTDGTSLTVRASRPDSKGNLGAKLGSLANGTVITGGYCLNNWMGVMYNGKQGFVSAEYLTDDVPKVPNVPSTGKPFKNGSYKVKARVTCSKLNVRKGRPNQANYDKIVDQLVKGEIIEVDYCLDGWFSTYECNSAPGFISGEYLELVLV